MRATREWLEQFTAITRTAVLATGWPVHSCIASCRVGLEVLHHFEISAPPEAVRFDVYSREAFAWRITGLPWPPPVGPVLRVRGTGEFNDDQWDGHLVLVPDGWLVDLSLDQATPPDRSLIMEPVVGPLPTHTTRSGTADPWQAPGAGKFIRDDGVVIHYQPIPHAPAEAWQHAIDWVDHEKPRRSAARAAIHFLEPITEVTGDCLHATTTHYSTDLMTLRQLDPGVADRLN